MKTPLNQGVSGTPTRLENSDAHVGVKTPNSDLAQRYVDRLREAMDGRSVADVARQSQLSHSTVRAYFEGLSLPSWENAVRIAATLGRSLDWFAHSEGETVYAAEIDDALAAIDYSSAVGRRLRDDAARQLRDFALIPLYDVRASAGHGAWNDDERISKMLAFRRDWLLAEFGTSGTELVLVYVDGDSMEPTIKDGDVVMVDGAQREIRDGLYVWLDDGALRIKRLQRLAAGRLQVLSDNPRFPAYELDLQAAFSSGAAQIIGRVVWAGVKL